MIVPRAKLLFWAAVVILPLALMWGLGTPATSGLALLGVLLFFVCAAVDALQGFARLEGIELLFPKLVRLRKDGQGVIDIQIKNEAQKSRTLRLGLALPRDFSAPQEDLGVTLPEDSEWSRLQWACTGSRRGSYRLSECHLETSSVLGFWSVRAVRSIDTELRVYPDLRQERKAAAAIFLNRGRFGSHMLRQVGKARDFEHLREYVPGDSYEDVHWKATAKRGHPITKIYQIERTQEVYVAIDASRLSARLEPNGATVLERFITAGLITGMAAEQQGDLFGLITFSDRIENFVRAKSGQSHYNRCRDAIYSLHPREVSPDFDELATFIRLRLRRRALLIILTSLDDPVLAENFLRDMSLICRQHVVLVNMVQRAEIAPMFSGDPVAELPEMYQRLAGHMVWQNLRELEKKLKRLGVRFSLVQNERLGQELINQYLSVKLKQAL